MDDDVLQDELDEALAVAGEDDAAVERLVRRHLHSAVYLFQQHFMTRVMRDQLRELILSGDIANIADYLPLIAERADASFDEFKALFRDELHRFGQRGCEMPN